MLAVNQWGVVLVIPGLVILAIGFVLILRPIVSRDRNDRGEDGENGDAGSSRP